MLLSEAINLLHTAREMGIGVTLFNDQLRLKVPRDKTIDSGLLDNIKNNRDHIIHLLKDERWKSEKTGNGVSIVPVARGLQKIPLSFEQERLWVVDHMEGSIQYHVSVVLQLIGALDLNALEQALQHIVNRHEVLRTVFRENDGDTVQHIMEKDNWKLSSLDVPQQQHSADALRKTIVQLISQPFDLSKDHMLRAHILQTGSEKHVLVATLHHIASDGWSESILVKELAELYACYSQGGKPALPALQVQYADYAIWQRHYLAGAVLEKKINYWRNQLAGLTPLDFPSDHTRPAIPTIAGGRVTTFVGKHTTGNLLALSNQEGLTLYMTLLSAFNILLYNYTDQEDICIGSSIAGRQHQEIEGLIGFFANTLPMRSRVRENMTVRELLQQVKQTTVDGYEHQELPFEKVVEVLDIKREANRNPVFQVMFVLENTPAAGKLELGNIKLATEDMGLVTSKFDFTLTISQSAHGLQLTFTYRSDLYRHETITRMVRHYEHLLKQMPACMDVQIGQLEMLSEAEEDQLLKEFGRATATNNRRSTVVSMFEEQVGKTPTNVAVVFEEQQLTYLQLNSRANQLAAYLAKKGVSPNSLVAVCMHRSLETITCIMGIMKAGAAYMPIDPDYPLDRMKYMLADSGVTVVLAGMQQQMLLDDVRDELPDLAHVINVEEEWPLIGLQTGDGLPDVQPDNLAYVIYTSGSTGAAKGVMIEHRNLIDYVQGLKQCLPIDKCKTFALVSTLSADLGNTVVYSSLLSGGALHLFSSNTINDAVALQEYFTANKINCLKIVPSHWKALSIDEKLLLPSKLLIFGGEALPLETVQAIRQSGASCAVANHYGPTETTIGKLLHPVSSNHVYSGSIPVGKPFSNTNVYILSKTLRLCPVGVPGELYIGGAGVARGYLNRPELTAERFVGNPFSKNGAKLYKTGDRVKWLADGNIEFIGRVDHQVKIRGYRVEPAETEHALLQSGMVEQAAVVAAKDGKEGVRLIGYVVMKEMFVLDEARQYLKDRLPAYMVPAVFVELPEMPLTANGKIDRIALPDPDADEFTGGQYIAPRTPLEEQLARIWEQVLEVERAGIHDNFFELGGHSLLAIRVISAIRKQVGMEVTIGDVFDYPSIALLAEQMEKRPGQAMLPPITPQPRSEQIPLSFSQERLWFLDQLDGTTQYHIPIVLKLKGTVDKAALQSAFQNIINRHEVLRTVIEQEDGKPYQRILESNNWQLVQIENFFYKEDPKTLRIFIDQLISQPFDLSRHYKLRAELLKIHDLEHILVITLHHISSDGWSNHILIWEMIELYKAALEGRAPQLAPLTVQYADYAIWQRTYLQGELLNRKLDYWKQKLSDVMPLNLPTDYPRPAMQSTRGAVIAFFINPQLTQKLQLLSQQEGATLFMTMLAAFKVLLYKYSGQEDICVGSVSANRQRQEVEGLIGFFVNTLALRSNVSGSQPFNQFLQEVKRTMVNGIEHQDVPFEKIVEVVVKERDTSRNPLFQVMFDLESARNEFASSIRLEGLELVHDIIDQTTSKFDLSVSMMETTDGLQSSIEYCTDLYKPATINRMISHYEELLRCIVNDPAQLVDDLQLMNAGEQHQLLVSFNDSFLAYPQNVTIVEMFAQQVSKTPDAIALVYEDAQLTYKELDHRAHQVAQLLAERGVKAEDFVGICAGRSLETLTGILGILKAGAAYVPIDPGFPLQRILDILEDTATRWVLADATGILSLPLVENIERIELNNELYNRNGQTISIPLPLPHYPAYVVYTSGSTGRPKGVLTAHESLVNIATGWRHHYRLHQKPPVVLSLASMSFDVFTGDICRAMLNGGTMILAPEDKRYDLAWLCETIVAKQVSFVESTPSLVVSLVKYAQEENADLSSLEILLIGADTVNARDYEFLYNYCEKHGIRLVNGYGVTEATVESSYFEGYLDAEATNAVPIGKPFANIMMYVINKQGKLNPVGIEGELCIAGPGLALGYLNHPELTAEKFVSDHFHPGRAMYRTGDAARWLEDGNIEFRGRKDNQVKIRGYRIEPGEIEDALKQLQGVRQAVVLAKALSNGNKQLVAYLVTETKLDRNEITMHLRSKLPEYMIPAAYVELDEMPLSANRKIDRKALLQYDTAEHSAILFEPLAGETEEQVANIWKGLLGVENIGANDNFFERGGHSILMVQMMHRMRKLGYEIQLRDLFEFQTIRKQAEIILANRRKLEQKGSYEDFRKRQDWEMRHLDNNHLLLLNEGRPDVFVFVIPGVGGMCDGFRELGAAFGDTCTVYGLQMLGIQDSETPLDSFEELAATNIRWMRQVQPHGPYRLIGHSFGAHVVFEMARQLEQQQETLEFLAIIDANVGLKKDIPPGETDVHFAIRLTSEYFEDFKIIQRPFPEWINELAVELQNVAVKDIVPYIGNFVMNKLPEETEVIKMVTRLVNVRTYNSHMTYNPTEKISSDLVIFKAAKSNVKSVDKTMGWGPYVKRVKVCMMPGDHSMVYNDNSMVVAGYLMERCGWAKKN